MEDQTQNLRAGAADTGLTDADPEKTLVAPRFDARESMTAQPVVPLADAPAVRREQRRQGTLPLVLILVSALVGGLVSVFAYRLYQQRAQQSSAREQQQPAAVEAPALTPEIFAGATAPAEGPAATPEVIEETQPAPDAEVAVVREAEVRDAVASKEEAEREEAREDRAGRDLDSAREREAREARPATPAAAAKRPAARRAEEITTPTEDLRVRRERDGGREASDYEVPARPRAERRAARRAERRAARRGGERNIDRVRAIFEGSPPSH